MYTVAGHGAFQKFRLVELPCFHTRSVFSFVLWSVMLILESFTSVGILLLCILFCLSCVSFKSLRGQAYVSQISISFARDTCNFRNDNHYCADDSGISQVAKNQTGDGL